MVDENRVGFVQGLSYPFRGLAFVFFKHPGLVRIWIFPILITFVVLVGLFWGAWAVHEPVVEFFWSAPAGDGATDVTLRFVHEFLEWIVAGLGFIVAIILSMLLSSVIAAPFNSKLSIEVERIAVGTPPPESDLAQEIVWILRTIGLEMLKVAVYLALTIPLWLLTLALPILSPFSSVVGFVVTALHAAVDFTDHPQERRSRTVWSTYRFAFSHFGPMFGFGVCVVCFLFIPLLNLVMLPAVVAGGTLLYLRLEQPVSTDSLSLSDVASAR